MSLRQTISGVFWAACLLTTASVFAQSAARESFTATASVKTAGGAAATAPVQVTVDRKMSQAEADTMLAAFKTGGAAGLRKALEGVPRRGGAPWEPAHSDAAHDRAPDERDAS
jgi:hypothetical protein